MKKGLGRGIGALIPDTMEESVQGSISELKISDIQPNPSQPRKSFDKEKLEMLSESIKEYGVLQPIVVQPGEKGFYSIIAGERRWRAARLAGLKVVPVVIKGTDRQTAMEIALVENLQREDLNPIEESTGYERLMQEFSLTQEDISIRVGKSRPAIANALRLLSLSQEIKAMVEAGTLSAGHARTLISLTPRQQKDAAILIIEKQLSVRQAEQLVKNLQLPKKEKADMEMDIELDALMENLSNYLGMKVKIVKGKNKGKLEIEYYHDTDLHKLVKMLKHANI